MDKEMLLGVDREGIGELVSALEKNGYFEAPASTKWHGDYKGGLVDHSYNVYILFKDMVERFNLQEEISEDSIILCSILHDICKIGAYIDNGNSYSWNKNQLKGHAMLSVQRIEKYITLTTQEKDIILYHMGQYGTREFLGTIKGEYSLVTLISNFNTNKLCKLFYFCDDMAAQFVDKKGNEL